MHDVNDDMDELFRAAAENYPLRTDGKDWNEVLLGLQQNSVPLPLLPAEKSSNRKRRTLWLLLLLPLIGLYLISYNHSSNRNTATDAKKEREDEKVEPVRDSSFLTKKEKANSMTPVEKEAQHFSDQSRKETDHSSDQTSFINPAHTLLSEEKAISESSFLSNKNNRSVLHTDMHPQTGDIVSQGIAKSEQNKNITGQPFEDYTRITKETESKQKTTGMDSAERSRSLMDSLSDSAREKTTVNTTRKIKAPIQPENGFYTGVVAGLDISTVKGQKVKKAGYGFDLLLGYRFSKHFSVESGLIWTSKKYYTKGKYFDKSRTGIPEESNILFTNGVCNMFEIPVVVKYDFLLHNRSNLFVTAGVSSYIMKEENYNYYANHNGWYYWADKKYKNSGSNLFSMVDISLGYQFHLNKHTSLRAEPYIKIPVTGVGIAKLPITSTGASIGITHSF